MLKRKVSGKISILFFIMVIMCLAMPQRVNAAMTLNELKSKFPAGHYWNGGNVNKTTTTKCSDHVNLHGPDGNTWGNRCNWFHDTATGWDLTQCWGFAFKCGYDAYGTMPGSWDKKKNLDSLKAGDIVRYGNGAHVIFITAVSGNNVTYGDCNKDTCCKIRWDVTCTKSDIPISNYNSAKMLGDGVYSAPYALTSHKAVTGTRSISDDKYLVESGVGGGQYMTIYGNSKADRANVTTYQSTLKEHVFALTYLNNGCYKIINTNSGKSLDIPGSNQTSSGANVQQYPYNGKDDQQWDLEPADNGYFYVRNKCGGYALDVSGGTVANGQNIQLYTFNKSKAQKWKFLTESRDINSGFPDGDYYIRSDVSGQSYLGIGSNKNIQLTGSKASAAVFSVRHQKNGRYQIIQKDTGLVLDVEGNEAVYNKKNVRLSANDNLRDQLWIIKSAGSGAYELINRINGFRLDVTDGKTASGTNVQVHYKNGAAHAQKWHFEAAWEHRAVLPAQPGIIIPVKADTSFSALQAKTGKITNKSVKLTWKSLAGADHYEIYGNLCGKNRIPVKLMRTEKGITGTTVKSIGLIPLKKGTYYQFIIKAFKGSRLLAESKTVFVTTAGSKKYTNYSKVSLKNVRMKTLILKKGKSFTLKTSLKKAGKKKVMKYRGLSYEIADTAIATVNSKGRITAKSAGKTRIYIYTQNGVSTCVTLLVR